MTASDIIDATFYLGIIITSSDLKRIVEELKSTDAGKIAIFTPTVFRGLSSRDTKAKLTESLCMITKNSLLLGQHFIERFFMTAVCGLSFINNSRYTPVRHDGESLEIRKLSFIFSIIVDTLQFIIRLSILIEWINRQVISPDSLEIFTSCSLLHIIFQNSLSLREAFWFSRRGRVIEVEVQLDIYRSRFFTVKCGSSTFDGFVYLQDLAAIAGDEELLNNVMTALSIFETRKEEMQRRD